MHEYYDANGVLRERWDDGTRTYTAWDADGNETESRPYTDAENANADTVQAARDADAAAKTKTAEASAIVAAIAATSVPPADGQAWEQPTGPQDAYPLNATVTHNGKTWVSLAPYNVWEPGVANWRESTATGYPEWVQPTGAQDAYALGARVTHGGADWESTVDANVWEPGVYGWETI